MNEDGLSDLDFAVEIGKQYLADEDRLPADSGIALFDVP